MTTYKPITRRYVDNDNKIKVGIFIAEGQFANGKLAYSLIAKSGSVNGNLFFTRVSDQERDEEQCCYIQYRDYDGLIMEHI